VVVLSTPRLRLTPLAISQLQTLLSQPPALWPGPALRLPSHLVTPQIEHALQAKIIKMQAADPALHLWFTYWLIEVPEFQVGAGLVGFKGSPDPTGTVEFGYGISEEYQGRGYMTEAVQALVGWAFGQPICRRIIAETLRSNIASQRVLQKSGFFVFKETHDTYEWELIKPRPGNE
jgi:[ribosomal protein S5]-alanine N-acetyltransferase